MTLLILGATGKTGRRLAAQLRAAGAPLRTAARRGADVPFDWDDAATHAPALSGAHGVYLLPPVGRLDHAPLVRAFLDAAEAANVAHVTLLSARGVEHAPPEAAMRAIELDLAGRERLTHTILRPGWFMQDFDEWLLAAPIAGEGVIPVPTGDGAEAFVHADDIAAVAAATLLDPAAHAGAEYTLAGPEPLTFAQVAERIGAAAGRPVAHADVSRADFVAALQRRGVPADYAELLGMLLDEGVRQHWGAAPTDDIQRVTGRPPRSFDDYLAGLDPVAVWGRRAA